MQKSLFGWIASSITLIYKLPQIYKLYKTKKSDDLSLFSLLIQCFGYIFYILHGDTLNDLPIMFMGGGALFETSLIIGMYFYYKSNIIIPPIDNTNNP
tara:strand:- start:1519 stop:1812 length:294 start_codon:yes stop_codon:yes gene_type:complete